MLKTNEGPIDRMLRIVVALVMAGVAYLYLDGTWQFVAYGAAAVLLLTGAIGFCGLYALFGVSTCPVKRQP